MHNTQQPTTRPNSVSRLGSAIGLSQNLIRKLANTGLGAIAISLFLTPSPAWAQIDNPAPDASAPGAAMITQVLGWLKWAGLAAALGGLLIGAVSVGVGHFGQHGGAAQAGRKWILGGMGAAILSGLAWTITTTLYNATA